jgi:hypothetical protein
MRAESEGKWVSEYLEESPFRLARSCSQSLAMFCERKRARRKGVGVRRERGASKSSQVFGAFTVANLSFRIAGSSSAIIRYFLNCLKPSFQSKSTKPALEKALLESVGRPALLQIWWS